MQRSNTTKGSTAWLEQSRPTHESHTHTHKNIRSVPELTDGQHPLSFHFERNRDAFTPADCGRAANQAQRPKVRTGTEFRNSLPQCIRLIDKTRQDGRHVRHVGRRRSPSVAVGHLYWPSVKNNPSNPPRIDLPEPHNPTQSRLAFSFSQGWGKTWVYPRAGPRSHLGSCC